MEMTPFADSLLRLYKKKMVNDAKLKILELNHKITKEEYEIILKAGKEG